MTTVGRIVAVTAGSAYAAPAADLFDEYRVHYGQTPEPDRAAAWLSQQRNDGGLRLYLAIGEPPGRPIGLISVLEMPASLRMGTFWSIRDLYVPPAHRRGGVARALLDHVVNAARTAGALRVSLQTEPDNAAAQALYQSAGFHPIHDLDLLSLTLTDGQGGDHQRSPGPRPI
ncbi:GNAT family N-acetyltransferase [Actinoplanes subglobosus]|uniref:GNAT family N-acetyltransferase n=1 Tax=Actinoplanes subglobosus TaxID=1547892 RepID=A0ABV8J714_9ACTN